jgi:uracil-DNA glycosylase family 4
MQLDIPKIRALPRNIRQDVRDRMLDQYFNNKYCKKCGLYKKVHNPYIEGRGNRESKLLIIGESPGINEDLEDTVAIGSTGEILQKRLNNFDMDYFIINSVKCRSVDSHNKNKTPTPKLINCCKPFTIKLIEEIKPKVILTLGRIATNQVLNVNLSIEIARGNVFYHPELRCIVIPTYHPMFLGYANDHIYYKEFENDLKLAKSLTFSMPTRMVEARPRSLKDPVDIRAYIEYLIGVDAAALDLETEGLDHRVDKITDISFCAVAGEGVHIKWSVLMEHATDIFRIFLLSAVNKVLMNGRFDWLFLRAVGFDMKNFNFDIMLAEHTYTMSREGRESAGLYNLNMLSWKHTPLGGYKAVLGEGGIGAFQTKSKVKVKKEEDLTKKKRKRKKVEEEEERVEVVNEFEKELEHYNTFLERSQKEKMEKSGLTPLEYYSALDSDATYRIYLKQRAIIAEQYSFVYNNIIMPLNYVLLRMTENGVRLDMDYMNQIKADDEKEMEKIKQKLFKKVGFEFNINSTQQLGDVLFKHLGVIPDPKMKTPKTGAYKLNETALVEYAKQKPSVKALLDYRSLKKQISTYIIGFQKYMDPITWRVHANYLQHTTATGRLSVTNPAIQTIPRDNRIRQMVVPSLGNKLVIGDLSQIELRILAMLSKDVNMLAAFNSGKDIHAMTACNAILHMPIEQFDKENKKHSEARTISKSINFGIVYGLSAYSLAVQLEFPMKTYNDRTNSINRAQLYIDNWFRLYSGASRWLEETKSFALKNGYVESVYGRRRYLPKVYSSDPAVKEAALRQATNMPIQSTAGDINNLATISLQKKIDETESKALLVTVVHDSIMCDTPKDEVDFIVSAMVESMTQDMPRITVPIKADIEVLDRWMKN